MKRAYISIGLLASLLLGTGAGCTKGPDQATLDLAQPVTLQYWRPFDGSDAFDPIINKYRALHPNVTIEYRRLRPEEYEQELVNALAEDRGPDLFTIPSDSLRGYIPKLAPMPKEYKMASIVSTGDLKGTTTINVETKKGLTARTLQQSFLDVVAQDVVLPANGGGQLGNLATDNIYGLPLSMDTLMLLYNKDILSNSGIAQPPTTWTEFLDNVLKITKVDEATGTITRPGAVIGTAENVPRSGDIVSLIMMQAGAQMVDDNGQPTFHLVPPGAKSSIAPGIDALRFYTDFASVDKKAYTWNELQSDGLESFIQGKVGFMFAYAYQLPLIKARAPKLNYGIAPVPQMTPAKPVNMAYYWVEGVSKKSKNQNVAWDFLLFAAQRENVSGYLQATQKPTALKSLVATQQEDIVLGPFADQLLTARTWYRGKDGKAKDAILKELITNVITATKANSNEQFNKAVENAVSKIGQTLY